MTLIRALAAALNVFAAVYPIHVRRQISRDIEEYEDEIFRLGDAGDPASKLQIERLAERKRRATKLLGSLRPSDDHVAGG